MKIALINPNRMKPAIAPIGLDYLADSLLAAGREVRLVDLCFADDPLAELERELTDYVPDAVGVTIRNTDDCYMAGQDYFLPFIAEVIARVKAVTSAPVVVGGVGYSVSPVETLKLVCADYGIAGDSEAALVQLLQSIENDRDPSSVPGVLTRHDDTIASTPPNSPDPATLLVRGRSLVDNARYFREGGQAGFETKRGCGMNCIYCPEPSAKGCGWRLLPPERVVAELKSLYSQGIDHFHTCDSEFNLPLSHAVDVCRAIIAAELGDKIRWYAYCSPEPFPDDLAQLMKSAGCAGIDFGADSADDDQLRRLGRHYSVKEIASAVRTCHKYGIPLMLDLLIGGPGETRETVKQTIDFTKSIDADCVGLSIGVRIYENTEMARLVRSAGPLDTNIEIHGCKDGNDNLIRPVFYISKAVGPEIVGYVHELVGGDPRFFLPTREEGDRNYNYNDNTVLVEAIKSGCRGAYWDILRRLRNI